MEDFGDRYGCRFAKLVDSRGSGKEFEFDPGMDFVPAVSC
jgi:hypothetical protein